jgi:hypothetical protein
MSEPTVLLTLQLQLSEKFHELIPVNTFEQLIPELTRIVYSLILNDKNRLLFTLYSVDLDDQKVLKILKDYPAEEASKLLAQALITRQLQKIKKHSQDTDTTGIAEDEKW